MALIPGLHDVQAFQILIGLPYEDLKRMRNVCHPWRAEMGSPDFYRSRRALGLTQPTIVVVQRWEDPSMMHIYPNHFDASIFRIAFFRQNEDCWSYLKYIPEYPKSFPPYCTIVGVRNEIVVLGGQDPNNCEMNLDSVFVYNFFSGEWRRGASMPDQSRILHFGCCSDSEDIVYVVGGSDESGIKTRSVMAYDVTQDNWTRLPDMTKAREKCQVTFRQGKLHVIHEYNMCYGTIKIDLDILDVRERRWESSVTENGVCEGIYVDDIDKGMYKCCLESREIFKREGSTWNVMTNLPEKVEGVYFSTMWENKLMVMCSVEFDTVECLTVDLKTLVWSKLDKVPAEYTQNIMSGCYLEM